jgi:UDP:flavonoid glycosyltransferase YjiC (YdhE family)
VVRALGQDRSLRALVVSGGEDLGPAPPHVGIVERAPQLEILRRASLMITHGGLGSVKECAALGVPMLVFPLKDDQPGNAARVEARGLGRVLRGPVLDEVRDALARSWVSIREEIERFEQGDRGVRAVEAMI